MESDGLSRIAYLFKILLVGDSSVGKSCLLYRFTHKDFSFNLPTTVAVDFYTKILDIEGQIIQAQLWDTAGQEKYASVSPIYYRGAKGAIVVFDILRRETFDHLDRWLSQLYSFAGSDVVCVIVGNKSDADAQRTVSLAEAASYAQLRSVAYMETSALDGSNVVEAFQKLVEECYKREVYPERYIGRGQKDGLGPGQESTSCRLTLDERGSFGVLLLGGRCTPSAHAQAARKAAYREASSPTVGVPPQPGVAIASV